MHNRIINLVKLNLIYKRRSVRIKLNKFELSVIKLLIKINLIKFIKKNGNYYDIYFNYLNNRPVFKNIKNISKPSKLVFASINNIKYITYKYKTIFVLNTNKGILTNFEALNLNVGGIIIFKLWN